ncbi:hypothetical protein Acr_01g0001220 [Actinidia rufa]|uniref:Protein FAR1-RELATED SEQUENCE n=1 Tax=Actinidia rufa TaxID=165716 RepID=A0A7J0E1C9_9ERIC|nr:hypothetical protein Acr_01g0001220 [Actinidia rufa]
MSFESVPSTQPPCLSGDNEQREDEISSGTSKIKCDEIGTNDDGNEANKNSEHKVEEPKEGIEFETSDEAYLYYSTYAKEKGFAVSKRNSRKGSDGKLMNVTFQCNRGGKARITTTNPVKPRPQTKIDCPARLNLSICRDGKWRLNKQYENALAKNVEIEKYEDAKSLHYYIPCITEDELEIQFQSVYTNTKFKEFQKLFVGRLKCEIMSERKVDDVRSEYEVEEDITFGEEKRRRRVSFNVAFNGETNEANCNYRLFEFKGIVCQHQLMVFHKRRVERVPEKYVLRRWRKDVRRVHTKVRINYDNSSSTIEARRHDNMCNLFNEVADLAEDCEEKYEKVMGRVRELKIELIESSVVCGSNVLSNTKNASSFSLGDVAIPSKESKNILDPKFVTRKGRPPTIRKHVVVEKMYKKKRETKNNTKEIEEHVDGNVFVTQESDVNLNSYSNYMPQFMWPNMTSQFYPRLCPTTNFNRFINMPSFPSSGITGAQVLGGPSSLFEPQGQDLGEDLH